MHDGGGSEQIAVLADVSVEFAEVRVVDLLVLGEGAVLVADAEAGALDLQDALVLRFVVNNVLDSS